MSIKTSSVIGFVPGLRDAAIVHAVCEAKPGSTAAASIFAAYTVEVDEDTTEGDAIARFIEMVKGHGLGVADVVFEQVPYSKRKGDDREARIRTRQLVVLEEHFPNATHHPVPAWLWRNRFHLSRGSSDGLVKKRVEQQLGVEFETENEAIAAALAVWAAEKSVIQSMNPTVRDGA